MNRRSASTRRRKLRTARAAPPAACCSACPLLTLVCCDAKAGAGRPRVNRRDTLWLCCVHFCNWLQLQGTLRIRGTHVQRLCCACWLCAGRFSDSETQRPLGEQAFPLEVQATYNHHSVACSSSSHSSSITSLATPPPPARPTPPLRNPAKLSPSQRGPGAMPGRHQPGYTRLAHTNSSRRVPSCLLPLRPLPALASVHAHMACATPAKHSHKEALGLCQGRYRYAGHT